MATTVGLRPPAPELREEFTGTVDHALARVRTSPALEHLTGVIPPAPHHLLYESEAAQIREVPASEALPSSLVPFVAQFVLLLASDEPGLFPQDITVGPNLLGPTAPIQGLLAPVAVHGQDANRRPVAVQGALIVPGFVGLPIRISRVLGVSEVMVCVGSNAVVGSFYDRRRDLLVFDLLG